jgi:DNA-binding SARP family transcriptional activator
MLPHLVTMVAAASAATIAWYRALEPRSTPPTDSRSPAAAPAVSTATRSTSSFRVGVLGPIIVERDGIPVELTPRMCELVAYLATHPHGVTDDQLRCAIWPDRSPSPASLRNLLWQTRQRLGDIDGEPVVAMADSDGRYRLAAVTSDFGLLDDAADNNGAAGAVLRMVRGRPFEARRGFEWAYAEGLVAWAERRIVAAAERVADYAIAAGDTGAAVAVIEAALLAVPTDERLFRVLIRVHAATGDRTAVDGVVRRAMSALDLDNIDELEPDTIAAYRDAGRAGTLSRRR